MSIVWLGFLGSLAAGMMTAVGAVPALFGKTVSRRTTDIMLGFAAGVLNLLRAARMVDDPAARLEKKPPQD